MRSNLTPKRIARMRSCRTTPSRTTRLAFLRTIRVSNRSEPLEQKERHARLHHEGMWPSVPSVSGGGDTDDLDLIIVRTCLYRRAVTKRTIPNVSRRGFLSAKQIAGPSPARKAKVSGSREGVRSRVLQRRLDLRNHSVSITG